MQNGREPREEAQREMEIRSVEADRQTLIEAKHILRSLWKQSRINLDVRSEGEMALSAALFALDAPAVRNVSMRMGALKAAEQWREEQARRDLPF